MWRSEFINWLRICRSTTSAPCNNWSGVSPDYFSLGWLTVAAVMGLLGLTLAIVGVYGVVSYSVSRRTHEIGIRVAVGASRNDILKLVSRQGLALIGAGVCTGLLAAWALAHAMASLLLNVRSADPVTFASVAVLLTLVALA